MTEITVCGSSSQGNGYLLKSGNEILVLELGCRFMDYVDALKDDFNLVSGCISTHCHSDHLNLSTAKEFIRRGVDIYVGEDVYFDTTNTTEFAIMGILWLRSNFRNKVGGFTVQTFKAPHNVPNYGFLIVTPTNERIIFLTDTTGVGLRFRNISCVMVECNHDDDTLLDNLANHDVSLSHPEWHLGLNDCINFCRENYSSSLKQIILIHMSHANVNEEYAVQMVQQSLPFDNVAVAHKGCKFEIDNDEF